MKKLLSFLISKDFGYAKNIFDVVSVVVSMAIALLIERRIIGIGVGTIASALLIGRVITLLNKIGKEKLNSLGDSIIYS